jgi:hypothetical protein
MARVKQAVPDAVRESLERIALGGPDIVGPAAEEVASRLQQLIVTHELPEGSRLPSE